MRTLLPSFLISTALVVAPSPADTPLRGFFPQSIQTQRDLESRFRAMPDGARMKEAMRRLSARPHHVGSAYDKDNAEWILGQFKSYGWDAHIENFDVLFPTPIDRVVELVAPTTFKASLQETALPGDPTSNQQSEQLPSYNAYSNDGDVTGPLVFVNYGIPADYEELEQRGISVRARSSSPSTAALGAVSNQKWPPSMAQWDA
jgi:N-acetylated-alpha-linked acidic dipeptidase